MKYERRASRDRRAGTDIAAPPPSSPVMIERAPKEVAVRAAFNQSGTRADAETDTLRDVVLATRSRKRLQRQLRVSS